MKRITMVPKGAKETLGLQGNNFEDGFIPGLANLLRQSYTTTRKERMSTEPLEVTIPGRGVLTWIPDEVPMRRYEFRATPEYRQAYPHLAEVERGRW